MLKPLTDEQRQIVATIRAFVEKDVLPVVTRLEHEDRYPHDLVEQMKGLGLFGAVIPEAYGGLGLDYGTYALIIEELARGWMSLAGIINSHLIMAHCVASFGTEEQRRRLLPPMARGDLRGGLALTEPHAGSDLQAIRTTAVRHGEEYLLTGTKMFVTNGRYGRAFALLARTDPAAEPPYRGLSLFIVEKGHPGFQVGRDIGKLGYKGVETVELVLEAVPVPAANLVGGVEGRGFQQVMAGLEVGRLNIAARAVGVARAAFEEAIRYAQLRHAFGRPIAEHQAIQLKLADMATRVEAARLLTHQAAEAKDRGARADLEAGMAKLFASEAAQEVALEAMRIHGGYGYTTGTPRSCSSARGPTRSSAC
ncbi:MAG: acyl-CoA dehydrogenase family protein [Candidatus Rokubacteria bacterium]|nr:acyl-CoA dehydrogenase family protein [Candidatus Rokubacteria bacterium]